MGFWRRQLEGQDARQGNAEDAAESLQLLRTIENEFKKIPVRPLLRLRASCMKRCYVQQKDAKSFHRLTQKVSAKPLDLGSHIRTGDHVCRHLAITSAWAKCFFHPNWAELKAKICALKSLARNLCQPWVRRRWGSRPSRRASAEEGRSWRHLEGPVFRVGPIKVVKSTKD